MRRFLSWRTGLAAVAVAGLAVPALAVSASAATVPGGGNGGGFGPQVFIIHTEGTGNPAGTVTAFGPIQGRGTDIPQSNTTDLFAFRRGSVNVDHRAVSDSQPRLDFRACTATIYEKGRWQLDPPGTGKYTRARGWGQYDATIVLGFRGGRHDGGPGDSAPQGGGRDHKCRIDLNGQPKTQVVDVFAQGQVSLGQHGRDS